MAKTAKNKLRGVERRLLAAAKELILANRGFSGAEKRRNAAEKAWYDIRNELDAALETEAAK